MPKQPNLLIKNALLSVLTFLKHKAEEKDLQPVITVSKLLELLPSGIKITYQQLVDLSKDPVISQSIKSINKNQVELKLGSDADEEPSSEIPDVQPENDENFDSAEDSNSDDFSFDETEENFDDDGEFEPTPQEPEEEMHPKPDVIKQMAKRAASRP